MASDEESIVVDAVYDGAEFEDSQGGDIPQLPPAERSKTFTFTSSGEFLLLRWLLKGLSLWHPRSSCCFSRYFYPGLISLFFAFTAVWILVHLFLEGYYSTLNFSLMNKLFVVVLFASAYLSHLVGWVYFRSRDFEDNMIFITLDTRQVKGFCKQMKYYNLRVITFSIFALVWLGFYLYYHNSDYSHGIDWLVFSFNIYVAGIYLAVLWVIDLLQLVSNARLRNQHDKFLKWTRGVEAAINDHICNYTTKVETSCRRLRLWFFVHNASLTILVPIVVLIRLLPGATINLYEVWYMLGYILVWAGPLYFAEQIEKNDGRFCWEVNNFCPEQLITAMQNTGPRETRVVTLNGRQRGESYQHLTFVSRTEVQLLVTYLKNIGSGFLAVGYTFQLKLSIVAAVFSFFRQAFE